MVSRAEITLILRPQFILSVVQIDLEPNLLLTVRLSQFSEIFSWKKRYLKRFPVLLSPLLVLYIILNVSVSDDNGSISVGIDKESLHRKE